MVYLVWAKHPAWSWEHLIGVFLSEQAAEDFLYSTQADPNVMRWVAAVEEGEYPS